jgi:hypothetical protein
MTPVPRQITAQVAYRWLRLPAALLVAAAVRIGLLVAGVVPFNADEAVVGLMARHILRGERPIFFYGQSYLGSLDAWLVAGAFALWAPSVPVIRLVQIGLFLCTMATTYWLGLRIYGSHWIAGAAATLLAIPAVLFTLYGTVSLGGYGEVLLIGNILLLLAVHLLDLPPVEANAASSRVAWPALRYAGWLLVGLLAGLGFWSFPLIVVYLIPILVCAAVMLRRQVWALALNGLLFIGGFGVGAAPWLWYTVTHGLSTIFETGGQAIVGASSPVLVLAAVAHLFNFLLFGLSVIWGIRPPWSAQFLALALIPYAMAIHIAVMLFAIRRTGERDRATIGRWLLAGTSACLVVGFVLTPFGADPSGRYFVPLAVPLALFTSEMLHWLRLRRRRRSPWRKWFGQSLMLAVIAFNWWGNVESAANFPPGLTTQFDAVTQVDQRALSAVIAFLRVHGETRGYTNYWVEYPLAFLSQEELIFVAQLPYHTDFRYTPRDDRYLPYVDLVAASPRAAYITTQFPELDQQLRQGLTALKVAYQESAIGHYHIFYGLSRKVTPSELGFGTACCS